MEDFKAVEAVFDLIEGAEVMQVFEDDLWIKVDRALYNEIMEHLYPSMGEEDDDE